MTPMHSRHRTCPWKCLLATCLLILGGSAAHAQTAPVTAPITATVPRSLADSPAASPLLAQLGIKPGSVHKIGVGLNVIKFRTIKVGLGGWVSVECLEANNGGWNRGEKYWVNLNNVVFVSAPFVEDPRPGATIKPKAR